MGKMEWSKLLTSERLGESESGKDKSDGRTAFDSDIGRIIFSGAFRRLGRKTQVHPLAANDHVHTRLTHSLEVAQVGKALGKRLGEKIHDRIPSDIFPSDLGAVVEAACLAHDIGNPPFGHAGEAAMSDWFKANGEKLFSCMTDEENHDLKNFEGNAQGFRIMTQTENHLFSGGMRLTYATLGTFLKYPWSSRVGESKFGAFLSEEAVLEEVAGELGLPKIDQSHWAHHPLAYLLEAADDICYSILDLEDAVELGILSIETIKKTVKVVFDDVEWQEIEESLESNNAFRVNLTRLRGPVFQKLVSGAVEGFMKNYECIMNGEFDGDVFDALDDRDSRKRLVQDAKNLTRDFVFGDSRKVEIELGSYATFEVLLEPFCNAAIEVANWIGTSDEEANLSRKSKLVMNLLGDHEPTKENEPFEDGWTQHQCLRRVIDHVSGMTDNYAIHVARQLQGEGFSGVQRP